MSDLDNILIINFDSIDLMSSGLYTASVSLLDTAFRSATIRLQAGPSRMSLVDDVIVDEDISHDDSVVLEMVRMNEWAEDINFSIYDRPCIVYGSVDTTNRTAIHIVEKTSFVLAYNMGLASHFAALNDTLTLRDQHLLKALEMYYRVANAMNDVNKQDDEDYIMLSLAALNNMISILILLSRLEEANRCLRALSNRLERVKNDRHLFLDVYWFCKQNVALRVSSTAICAPCA